MSARRAEREVRLLSADSVAVVFASLDYRLSRLEAVSAAQHGAFGRSTTYSTEYLAGARQMLEDGRRALDDAIRRSGFKSTSPDVERVDGSAPAWAALSPVLEAIRARVAEGGEE